ncbi:MerR family transcriptional regulator [Paracoccaceae bacterium Fryx2]|nr:MerR family transcriptional regulator [Paracoccaceae bacterium Fryx2]
MEKSADAFRTISEVAEFLETPAHVLRFWESRFPQIRPVKRAGGRRYYRPADVALLAGIRRLLHDEGMTIRGVQKVLREQGVRHVAGLSEAEALAAEALDGEFTDLAPEDDSDAPAAADNVVRLPMAEPDRPAQGSPAAGPAPEVAASAKPPAALSPEAAPTAIAVPEAAPPPLPAPPRDAPPAPQAAETGLQSGTAGSPAPLLPRAESAGAPPEPVWPVAATADPAAPDTRDADPAAQVAESVGPADPVAAFSETRAPVDAAEPPAMAGPIIAPPAESLPSESPHAELPRAELPAADSPVAAQGAAAQPAIRLPASLRRRAAAGDAAQALAPHRDSLRHLHDRLVALRSRMSQPGRAGRS